MNQTINSPFRYAGGKFYARKLILGHVPQHEVYIEPFAGGASIFFAKMKANRNWLNDIDKELMNCYTIIRDHPEKLIAFLRGEKASKERHHYYKNIFQPKDDVERAGRWFYVNRTSYSGIMKRENCYWGYGEKFSMGPQNWPGAIEKASQKLLGVKLSTLDFEDVINTCPDGSFLFVDPPYFNADQNKFYTHGFKPSDHYRLANCLKQNSKRIGFLLTYDNSPEIRKLYSWAGNILEQSWNYTINRTDDQSKKTNSRGSRYKGHELFIMNCHVLPGQAFLPFDPKLLLGQHPTSRLLPNGDRFPLAQPGF